MTSRPADPHRFVVEIRRADGLAFVRDNRTDGTGHRCPWTRARARKPGKCAASGAAYPTGATVWAPLGYGMNRADRITADAFEALRCLEDGRPAGRA